MVASYHEYASRKVPVESKCQDSITLDGGLMLHRTKKLAAPALIPAFDRPCHLPHPPVLALKATRYRGTDEIEQRGAVVLTRVPVGAQLDYFFPLGINLWIILGQVHDLEDKFCGESELREQCANFTDWLCWIAIILVGGGDVT